MLILRDLLWRGPHGYQELLEANPGISPTLLSQRLETLADHGLVEKVEVRQGRRLAAYRLTARGRGVEPVIKALYGFGEDFMSSMALSENKLEYLLSLGAGNMGPDTFELEATSVRLTVDEVTVVVEMGPGRVEVVEPHDDVAGGVTLTQTALIALATGDDGPSYVATGDPEATDQLLRVLARSAS